jgi:hypothetical protein
MFEDTPTPSRGRGTQQRKTLAPDIKNRGDAMNAWGSRTGFPRVFTVTVAIGLVLSATASSWAQSNADASTTRVGVVFSGGHETDPRDRGRPVVLIAAALGVPSDVFREAFTHVRPAPAGTAPDPRQVRDNKAALMDALGPYGITNERLDAVSNYYRYVRRRGKLWPTKPAAAYALVREGKITGFVVTNGGSGYTSPPTVTVRDFDGATAKVELSFSKQFAKNGSVASIKLVPER